MTLAPAVVAVEARLGHHNPVGTLHRATMIGPGVWGGQTGAPRGLDRSSRPGDIGLRDAGAGWPTGGAASPPPRRTAPWPGPCRPRPWPRPPPPSPQWSWTTGSPGCRPQVFGPGAGPLPGRRLAHQPAGAEDPPAVVPPAVVPIAGGLPPVVDPPTAAQCAAPTSLLSPSCPHDFGLPDRPPPPQPPLRPPTTPHVADQLGGDLARKRLGMLWEVLPHRVRTQAWDM